MNLHNYTDLLSEMTKKEIKARYKKALLGFLWIFINPLLQMLIIGFVFQNILRIKVDNYFIFLFPGLLAWNFFSYSLTKATSSIVFERDLIQKAKFPREFIPLSIVLSNYFNFLISLLLFVLYIIISGGGLPFLLFSTWFYLLLSLFWLLLFTCGLSLLTAALNVKYRDVNFFVQAIVILWFYITPIMYTLGDLPSKFIPLFRLNPLTYPFETLRLHLIGNVNIVNGVFYLNLIISVFIILAGTYIFYKESKYFSDWL